MHELWARIRFRRDHRWVPDRTSEYLDDELAPGERTRVERHVGECIECRRLLASLTQIVTALHGLPAPEGGREPSQLAGAVRLRLGQRPAS
jgi:anti-sigma factor RsiW